MGDYCGCETKGPHACVREWRRMLSETALRKLPSGRFVRFTTAQDMDRRTRNVVVWQTICEYSRLPRLSFFDIETGEYIGEA